jgi:hypothetical protein
MVTMRWLTATRAQADATLPDKRVPPIGNVVATHLARTLIPFSLREAEFLEDQLEKALVLFLGPDVWLSWTGGGFLCDLNRRERRIGIDAGTGRDVWVHLAARWRRRRLSDWWRMEGVEIC